MKSHTEPLEHASVRQHCMAVRLPAIGANFVSLAGQAVKENQTHIRYLEALLQMESEERDRQAIARQPDGSEKRAHRAVVLGLKSQMKKWEAEKKLDC